MENQQPSLLQRLTQSHVLLIGIAITVLIIVIVSGIFLFLRQSSQKPDLEPIPENAIYTADEIVVKFKE
ncbi:MAG TPA: hypothetical protein PLD54_01090 [Candidatus Levybacteria bacterium]|nr:hypothetical protein [Candidatus Levybacteria bacterium]